MGKSSPCHASLKCLNFEGSFRCVEKCTISNGYRLVYSQGKEFCVGKFHVVFAPNYTEKLFDKKKIISTFRHYFQYDRY